MEPRSDHQTEYFAHIALAHAASRPGEGAGGAKGQSEVTRHLLEQILGPRATGRPWSGLALGVLGARLQGAGKSVDTIVGRALADRLRETRNPAELGAYALGLGVLGHSESEALLRRRLADTRDDVARGYLCLGLGLMGANGAMDEIERIVRDSRYRPELLRQAAISLGLLGDKRIVDDLIDLLASAPALSSQAALSAALGAIGDARSLDPLVAMLASEALTARARGFAAAALGIVADKEPMPWNAKIGIDLNYRASTSTLNDPEGTGILNLL